MGWVSSGNNRATILGELPDLAAPFSVLYDSLWQQSRLPAQVLELCRLRLAQLHRCDIELKRTEIAIPVAKIASLSHWNTDTDYTEAERACLAFTEVYAMDAQAITDDHADGVKAHFGDAGLVLLVEALGILDGMIRLSLLWQLSDNAEHQQNAGAPQ